MGEKYCDFPAESNDPMESYRVHFGEPTHGGGGAIVMTISLMGRSIESANENMTSSRIEKPPAHFF